jgi:hypothetical protein
MTQLPFADLPVSQVYGQSNHGSPFSEQPGPTPQGPLGPGKDFQSLLLSCHIRYELLRHVRRKIHARKNKVNKGKWGGRENSSVLGNMSLTVILQLVFKALPI